MAASAAVGRGDELAEVHAFLHGLQSGSSALALEGEPGIGKTTIWQAAVDQARAAGMIVLSCRPAAAEAKLSYSGLADMLAGVGQEQFARLPTLQRHALEVALLRSAPDGPGLDPRLVATALLSLIRGLAVTRTVLVAVDDAQWLDGPTNSILAFAARRLDGEPVGVLSAFRPHAEGLGLLDSVERERVRRIRVGPLATAPLAGLVAERAGRPLPRPLLARIAEAAHGNPFYALEVARLLPDDATALNSARLPVPDDVRTLAASRVGSLPAGTRSALLRAAVLAAPAAGVVDWPALAPAEEVGLVSVDERGRIEFSHPLFAAAIYGTASETQRREAHRAAAAEVRDPEQRARHLAYGSDGPDSAVAAELDAAAELASSRGAPDAAAELLELALRHSPETDDDTIAGRRLRAAGLHLNAGHLERARLLLAELLGQPAGDGVRATALRLRASLESHSDSFSAALASATEALAAAAGDPSAVAVIELDVAFYLVGLGQVGEALRHAETAAGRAELPGGDPGVLADALAVVTMVSFLNGDGIMHERLDRALALEDPDRQRSVVTSPRYIAGLLLMWTGRMRQAVQTMLQLRAERVERGIESDVLMFSLYLVWAYLWLGQTDRAAAIAGGDSAAARLLGDRGLSALALSASALVSAQRGELTAARAEANEALELFTGLHWWSGVVWPRWALGFAELSAGDPAAAHAALEPLTAMLPSLGLADPAGLCFLPDEIEALVALGEVDRAQGLVELLRRLGEMHDRPWAMAAAGRGLGLIATARGELDQAITAFEHALSQHARVEMPFERGRTLLALGRARRRRKSWGQARAALDEAMALFEQTGATLWAQAARGELARAGERPRGRFELTPTERRVAELAASGLTNREVAERAFLTVKGVEANLTRAYRKLGIRSRGGLARALERDDEPVGPAG
jgi:DNA-binding CsgD family transcriptional regulator